MHDTIDRLGPFAAAARQRDKALPNSIPFGLGERGGDREEQFRKAVAGHIAAEIKQMQLHAARLQAFDHLNGVKRGPEQAIKLRGDRYVARF